MPTENPGNEQESTEEKKPLRRRVAAASLWTVANTFGGQVIRLASNLILARLLFPEAFGLMALVNAILMGLEMFSDFGVGPSVIQAKDPHPRLLDVAWSLHVVRGLGLFFISSLLAYPASLWYDQPKLLFMIPAMGLVSVIRGFSSPTQYTLNRDLRLREISQIEIGSQLVGVIVSSAGAYLLNSVWALVFGAWASALGYCVLTYAVTQAPRPKWYWDRDILRSITHFGRWVMLSTILSYILNQGDRLILGSFMTLTQLGLYQIANVLARAVTQYADVVAHRVLFPVYAQVGRETTPELIRRITKVRLASMGLLLPPSWALVCFGDYAVRLLWDSRYHGAGWMVRILAAGGIFMSFSAGPLFLARGEPWVGFLCGVLQASVLLPAMIIGAKLYGPEGLVVAVAVAQMADYAFEVWVQRRYQVWLPKLDLLGFTMSIAVIAGGLYLRSWLNF